MAAMKGWQIFGGGQQSPTEQNENTSIPVPSSTELAHWVLVC